MTHLHLIAHTHWDREWYLPFQEFRLKLIHLIDRLLAIMHEQEGFTSFMLDGQAIVLEDYLEMRPERRAELEGLIRSGRVLIGPWYILPDEFLVSPESLIRNLLLGREVSSGFGSSMQVGYLPDPFGHIAQMPQILAGFGIKHAAFRRGLGDEALELRWEAPDGSGVLVSYLRDGYDNATRAPVNEQAFEAFIASLRDSLLPHAASTQLLLMNGTDHHEPQPEIPGLIAASRLPGNDLSLSTLPTYFADLEAEIVADGLELPVIRGDLRDSSRHHLLPGVLSSRTWIKQRNHACETLLERWAEPFSTLAQCLLGSPEPRTIWTGHLATPRLAAASGLLKQAWRMLLTCHPHDSICGCSIDQVHDEMRPRFDQVEQIGEEITRQSLQDLADAVNTFQPALQTARAALVVFNPHPFRCSARAKANLELGAGLERFQIIDERGEAAAYRLLSQDRKTLADMVLDADGLRAMMAFVQGGEVMGLSVQEVVVLDGASTVTVDVTLAEEIPPDTQAVEQGTRAVTAALQTYPDSSFRLLARFATRVQIELYAREVPGVGYRTFWLQPGDAGCLESDWETCASIENRYLEVRVEADGTLTLIENATGYILSGQLQFSDTGERGDSYSHAGLGPGEQLRPASCSTPERRQAPGGWDLRYSMRFELPAGLTPEREARLDATITMPVRVHLYLAAEDHGVELDVELENQAADHRLQLLFPSGIPAGSASYDAAFRTAERSTALPDASQDWIEDPVVEQPVRNYVSVAGDDRGLLVATRGLREASVSPEGQIALTLLRCFGWLSRDDLPNRRGGAGPQVETPGGQETGWHRFELKLIPFGSDAGPALREAQAFQAMLQGMGSGIHPGQLLPERELIRVEPASFELTACKTAEDGGLILRGFNRSSRACQVRLRCGFPFSSAWVAGLDERRTDRLPVEESDEIRFDCGGHALKTILLELPGQYQAP